MSVGQRIRQARQRAGMTQGALGKLAGYDRHAIYYIEKGRRNASIRGLDSIAWALGVSLAWLILGED